jgi:muramoyltetrapeptide carboxypeptidase LdcA involved in peptidoglycan recycling
MTHLTKPPKLNIGDKVATVSLSSGAAGDPNLLWRYEYGVSRLHDYFGLDVIAMPNALKGSDYISRHPEARAEDMMRAFSDASIKGIFAIIGGNDSIRMLPYIDLKIIRSNPKVFMGFSDTTSAHLMCYQAGLSTFYGPLVLREFADNVRMHSYTTEAVTKAMFNAEPIGDITPSPEFADDFPDWTDEAYVKATPTLFKPNTGYELLQGRGKVHGHLLGGCLAVLELCKNTAIYPTPEQWEGAVLFIESGGLLDVKKLPAWLRNYGESGILERLSGIVVGKPRPVTDADTYKETIIHILREFSLTDLPVLFNLPFGHTCPTCVLPYGALAEIDCDTKRFSILESGVV